MVGDLYQEQENTQANAEAAREIYENGELSQADLEEFERRALEAKANLPDKAIAHALVGGLTALLGGGDFIKGATAAGMSEKAAEELKEELPNNPLLKNMVATLVGTSLSGELEGGIIAANADKFNRQLHPSEMVWIEEHAKTFADNEGISEQVAKLRLTQQALKELDLGMRLTLNHSLDTSASEFLKSASNLSFSNDLGQSQALFSLQGNQYVRPALFATEVDIQFYKENVHRGVEYQPGEGLNVFLDDFQARGEQALSGLPLHVKEKIKDISVKVQEDPSYASRYMREVQLSGFVSAVKAYSALNRCVSSVECLSGMANSVKDGAVRQSHALGESGAVVMDDTSKELLNEVYGQDVEGMSKTLLAAQSALVLAEVIPAVKIAKVSKADGGRVEEDYKVSENGKGLLHSDIAKKTRAYLDDVQNQTGVKVPNNQRDLLADSVRNNQYTKLSKEQAVAHRKEFNKNKNKLITEWETQTGQKWPRYNKDVASKNGTITRKAGQPYDAHHLIESSHGGPNQWWNIHPARFPDQHQGGIHRSGSPARDLFSGDN